MPGPSKRGSSQSPSIGQLPESSPNSISEPVGGGPASAAVATAEPMLGLPSGRASSGSSHSCASRASASNRKTPDHIASTPDLVSKGIGRRKLLWPAVMPIFVGHWGKQ